MTFPTLFCNIKILFSSETGKPVHISMKVGDDCKMSDSDQKKDDIHFGVSDEHGKECEVEIDAPEEEQEEGNNLDMFL